MSQKVSALYECQIEGDRPILVEPGEYELIFQHHRTAFLFKKAPKLCLYFKIVTPGKFNGIQLARWYNVKRISGKPRKGGAFTIGWHCDFLREYVTLFGVPNRIDRISTQRFKTVVVKGRVFTVTKDSSQRGIPDKLQYSIVKELLGVCA